MSTSQQTDPLIGRLVDGRYRAYGQRLLVQRGNFLFTGPLDNPALDFEAIRELAPVVGYDNDVEVGLQVTGTLQDPQARVFSKPAMPESSAVYYLLTGRPPPEGTTGTEFSAGGTLLSLGLLGGQEQAAMDLGFSASEAYALQSLAYEQISAVPEPSQWLMLAAGGGFLVSRRRRTSRSEVAA